MTMDPYRSDIPTPSQDTMPKDDLTAPDFQERSVAATWILLAILLVLFIGALYLFAPDRTTSPRTAQTDNAVTQSKSPNPR
jgi:flagellar basal body-associated protein FliL